MTPELWAALIGAVVLLLTNTAAVIKVWGDNIATKDDRVATKEARNKDSAELHDKVLALEFRATQNKDNISLLFEQVADTAKAVGALNTQFATLLTKVDSVLDTLKELKERNRG
jgi:hypothetical protein